MSAALRLCRGSGRVGFRVSGSSVVRFDCVVPAVCSRSVNGALYRASNRFYASKSFPPHTIVTMPALSPTMTAGNIGTWQKKVGDSIAPGDVLVEIETDKAQMDFEFQEEGVLAKILKDSGEKDVAVGNPIAVLVEEGGDVGSFESFTLDDAGGEKEPPKPEEKESEKKEEKSDKEEPKEEKKESSKPPPDVKKTEVAEGQLEPSLYRVSVSPRVKAKALEKGVPLGEVKGTGINGRITVEDVEKYKPKPGAAAPAVGGPAYEDIPITGMRKTIASRLSQSMNTSPHYYVSGTLSVTKLLKLRQSLNSSSDGKYKLSVNDFLVKAVSVASRRVPAVNSSWLDKEGVIRQYSSVDVSVAVATPTGLMTPIVKNVDKLGLQTISSTVKDLGKKAKDGKLKPDEYQGGTITISNMGMNPAVERFTAVINPPQSCILAVGTVRKVAVPLETEDGTEVAWDDQLVVTGSFDHRVVDGAVGGEWIAALKKVVENPLELLL